ncbi:MAG: DUF4355 domain-containing protein [Porcipelethomonas sp.]
MNEITTGNPEQGTEKLFTQSELNRIISERLSRDRAKGTDDLEKRENDLTARELKFMAKQLLAEKGLPAELADILKLEDETGVRDAVELLAKLIGTRKNNDKLKVMDEQRLPGTADEEKNFSELRKAFGLI